MQTKILMAVLAISLGFILPSVQADPADKLDIEILKMYQDLYSATANTQSEGSDTFIDSVDGVAAMVPSNSNLAVLPFLQQGSVEAIFIVSGQAVRVDFGPLARSPNGDDSMSQSYDVQLPSATEVIVTLSHISIPPVTALSVQDKQLFMEDGGPQPPIALGAPLRLTDSLPRLRTQIRRRLRNLVAVAKSQIMQARRNWGQQDKLSTDQQANGVAGDYQYFVDTISNTLVPFEGQLRQRGDTELVTAIQDCLREIQSL